MKVSVLIPMYNAEKYISTTIDNVLKQTWQDIEIIIVDDGSSDNSYEIAKGYESEILKVLRQDNRGASAARNLAFEKCTGDLIQYLDADDLLSYNKIEAQVGMYLSLNDPKAVIASGIVLFETDIMDSIAIPYRQMSTNHRNDPIQLLIDICYEKYIVQSSIWLVHRSLIEQSGGWNEQLTLNDDGEFFFRIVASSSSIYFCSQGTVFYRNTPKSLSKQVSEKAIKSQLLSAQIMSKVITSHDNGRYARGACANYLMQYITRFDRDEYYLEEASKAIKELGFNIDTIRKSKIYKVAYSILGRSVMKRISQQYYNLR